MAAPGDRPGATDPVAARILADRRARRGFPDLGAEAPADVAAGYALQFRLAQAIGAVPPAGFKIGATAKGMQAYLGLEHPCAGFCPAEGIAAGSGRFRFADLHQPGVECEIGIRLGRDIAHGAHTRESVEDAVEHVFAAIEVVDQRYGDFIALGAPGLIADSVFHAGGVTGAPASGWPGLDLPAARGRLLVDGVERAAGTGAELLGHPMEALAWLASSPAAEMFGGLRAGQVVFLGSVTPVIWLDGPCEVTAGFDLLGEATARFV
ncbi:2-keto-4-pentenoate hydratase [Muricoccus pecuniae]|uniref:2-keto-4-pentenoate hydratase n=1 Tax=Muricoccus pecuniae TaxID=693023 RepID=A0A840YJX5_9PROT|nr:fumarylacetoacetate hydrolase family protein [Roseomonas pecuniae]MBB5694374.1 2-keto-4-pentenoate hydratase [Roseomonas pecuniae]